MQLTRQQRIDIELQAVSLYERLTGAGNDETSAPAGNFETAQRILDAWKRAFAGDERALLGRLSWDRLDEPTVLRRLAEPLTRTEPAAWTDWLNRFARHAADDDRKPGPDETPIEIPFVEIWLPMVHAARAELDAIAPELDASLTDSARGDLERLLLREFARTGELALFDLYRTRRRSEGIGYERFVADMLADGYASLFASFPVLARQLARLAETWVRRQAEFLERLTDDRAEIERHFGRHALGRLTEVRSGISDRHDDGRRIALLRFECGFRLAYKPRDLGLEAAFANFLAWSRREGLACAALAPRLLVREGYGWVEFAERVDFPDRSELERFYRQAGSLLFVAHLLRGKDLHMENVIATANGPVVVDAEMLFQPERGSAQNENGENRSEPNRDSVEESCLSSGLLSQIETDRQGSAFDVGGLRGTGGFLAPTRQRRWTDLGTDAIRPVEVDAFAPESDNRPFVRGVAQSIDDHRDAVTAGFVETYRFFLSRKDDLLAADGPLAPFADRSVRVLIRPTRQYGFVLQSLAAPGYQRSGLERDLALESLQREQNRRVTRPLHWPLVADERADVDRLDVPRFTVGASKTALRSRSGEAVDEFLSRSGYEMVRERAAGLDEEDLQRQIGWLRFGLGHSLVAANPERPRDERPAEDSRLERAAAIGDEIWSRATVCADGALRWECRPPGEQEGGADLYSGLPGTALLFAALARVSGEPRWAERAERLLQSVSAAEFGRSETGIGIGDGIASTAYAFGTIGSLLDRPEWIERADTLLQSIDADRIEADRSFDLTGGTAGAMIAWLDASLRDGCGDKLDRAVRCGEHLLRHQRESRHGGAAWPRNGDRSMTGWAHGAAGIGYALARLAAATGNDRYRHAAEAAFAYERALYSASRRNWPIVGQDGEPEQYLVAWCHGAPGVALSRGLTRACRNDADSEIENAELEAALATTARPELGRLDHLCCGNLGRSEVLWTLGRKLRRPDIAAAGDALLKSVLQRADRRGHFAPASTRYVYRSFDPGFFRGLAGIGYRILRSVAPDRLPSVLAFEPITELADEGRNS